MVRPAHFPVRFREKLAHYFAKDWLRCLILAVIGIAVRSPALQGPRIWDDQYLSAGNPFMKSPLLILEAFRHYLYPDGSSGHYRPVQNISFMFDYFFWNADVYGFHLTNVLLHVAAGILLYLLLRRLFGPLWSRSRIAAEPVGQPHSPQMLSLAAWFVALLWVVHPVHSAAIDYIAGRADSLACLFSAGGWLLFLRAREVRRPLLRHCVYTLAAIAGLLALCSREIACIWLVLFCANLLLIDKTASRRLRLGAVTCCLLLAAIYGGLRQLPGHRSGPAPEAGWTPAVRAVLMVRALGDYGRLLVFPNNLHMERTVFNPAGYDTTAGWRSNVQTEYLSITGLLLLGVLVYGCCKKGEGQRARRFGAGWFLLAYLPTSNLVQLNATVAEHWLYLPSAGFLIFAAGCVLDLSPRFRRGLAVAACLAVVGLGVRSAIRSSDWADEETFYKRTLAAGGVSTRVGVNLAMIYSQRGDYATAERMFRRVLEITPDYPIARNNLADVLYRQGKVAEAQAMFAASANASAESRKQYPRTWIAAINLAHLHHKDKNDEAALTVLGQAHANYPGTWEIISFQAEVLREQKKSEAALDLVQKFARDNWWHYGAALALGRLYAQNGDVERADAALRHASWLDVHDVEALNLIAAIRFRQNRFADALETQRRAVARQPDQPRQYLLLSDLLEKTGRRDEARATVAQVERLQAIARSPVAVN